ncbi:hypothetical protein TGRUB_431030 [Toxoplasma gondii RUB]|uniref:Uncharacterized protein n=1 Tax=Toxoplasma gondii RUB TaxID=935652 RepID=A0A086LZE8_TOXGO|nr:hypothetical protein TGRUB_431030 [Toxoplasma gondii RUB]
MQPVELNGGENVEYGYPEKTCVLFYKLELVACNMWRVGIREAMPKNFMLSSWRVLKCVLRVWLEERAPYDQKAFAFVRLRFSTKTCLFPELANFLAAPHSDVRRMQFLFYSFCLIEGTGGCDFFPSRCTQTVVTRFLRSDLLYLCEEAKSEITV